jgi:serine protease
MIHLLKASATAFPVNPSAPTCTVPTGISPPQDEECNCTTQTCGAGMLDTGAAIAAALRPLAVLQTTGTVVANATLNLNGASSFASQGRSIVAHQWSIHNVNGATPVIANTSSATTTLQIPGESQFTLRLTVTDDQGAQDTQEAALATSAQNPNPNPNPTPPPAPAPTPSPGITNTGSGGGGQLGWELFALALLGVSRWRSRSTRASHA